MGTLSTNLQSKDKDLTIYSETPVIQYVYWILILFRISRIFIAHDQRMVYNERLALSLVYVQLTWFPPLGNLKLPVLHDSLHTEASSTCPMTSKPYKYTNIAHI